MTQTTTSTDFRKSIKGEYNVTDEQLDACSRYERSDGRAFYCVQSQSNPGTYYRVEFNAERGGLQCLPHSGEHCKASLNGICCWHKRAAVAAEKLYRYYLIQAARREQAAIEAEAAHREEQAHADLEAAKLNAEAAKREAAATKRDGARAYSPRPFSLLK